jgi:hypothetical protein
VYTCHVEVLVRVGDDVPKSPSADESVGQRRVEIRRVLRPSGSLLIVAEGHEDGRFDVVTNLGMRALRATHLIREQLRAVLSKAGYQDIEISPHLNGRWISVFGKAA